MTVTHQQCKDWGSQLRQANESFYTPRISVLEEEIRKVEARGEDPTNVVLMGGAAKLNYVILLEQVRRAKEQSGLVASEKEQECMSGSVPDWLGDAQKATDTALALVMLPFLLLTQQYAAAHIDLSEIYKGKPLGGDNALIPKVRNDVLDALGIGGDLRQLITKPESLPGKALEELEGLVNRLPKIRIKW